MPMSMGKETLQVLKPLFPDMFLEG